MRGVKIFSGSSHPALTAAICERLSTTPDRCDLSNFANGETSVGIGTSIRNQDVFIVQSGSRRMNDSVMELLIMISACKGGSAKTITAVVPYFPYSRQSKKKAHRGAITARMLANLLSVAGVTHVITVDLHAPPMQGFFGKPVDNLRAEPLIARWLRNHVPDWREAVVVSKNAGGSKRVTSLADTLKLNFGIITTDRRREDRMSNSTSMDASTVFTAYEQPLYEPILPSPSGRRGASAPVINASVDTNINGIVSPREQERPAPYQILSPRLWPAQPDQSLSTGSYSPQFNALPLPQPEIDSGPASSSTRTRQRRSFTVPIPERPLLDDGAEEYTDERAREVITGRLVQGHIVDDDPPSPPMSTGSGHNGFHRSHVPSTPFAEEREDPMNSSMMSTMSSRHGDPMGGTLDAEASDDEEASLNDPEIEHTVTLVGNVKDRTVFIIDDMIDRAESWIAAAETVVKRGGAKQVFCIATHGLFGVDSLEAMEECDCIDKILVCNTFPIEVERSRNAKKLVILDIATLLSEAMRRNHFGESVSQIYQSYRD